MIIEEVIQGNIRMAFSRGKKRGENMKANKCGSCQQDWQYGEAFKLINTNKSEVMPCPKCGEKQYLTKRAMSVVVVLFFLPFIAVVLSIVFTDVGFWKNLQLWAILYWLSYFFRPILLEVSNKNILDIQD